MKSIRTRKKFVRLFQSELLPRLEKKVNDWVMYNDIRIVTISVTKNDGWFLITILYERDNAI